MRNTVHPLCRSLLATVLTGVLSAVELCCAESPTLLRWGADPAERGGPNLNEPLVTDRPDFTEASSTVGQGVVQVEMGYTYSFDDDGTDRTVGHSYPEPLLRVGMFADWFELRVGWNYATESVDGVRTSGGEDLYLGIKFGLTPQGGVLPEMALITQMTVPTGVDAFSSDETLPGINWLYGWDVTECISTGGSTQYNRAVEDIIGEAYTEWAQSWTINYGLLDQWTGYTEWFALFPHSAEAAAPEHYFNGGFAYLLSNNVQWDIRAGVGLNDAADDYFAGTGLSVRFQ